MPRSPGRRTLTKLRGHVRDGRRVLARADAIQHARRSLLPADPDAALTQRRESREQLADGTLVVGRWARGAPVVRRFRGDRGRVVVGDFVSIGEGVEFYCGGMHRSDWVAQYGVRALLDLPGAYEDGFPAGDGDIHVGQDAFLAPDCTVMSGVTIGPGAVVATHAVVTSDVAPYAIVAGVPATQIGQRFSDAQIAALLRIAWWDWPVETIRRRVGELCGADLDAFVAAYDEGPDPT